MLPVMWSLFVRVLLDTSFVLQIKSIHTVDTLCPVTPWFGNNFVSPRIRRTLHEMCLILYWLWQRVYVVCLAVETFLGRICAGEQSIWRAGDRGWRSPLSVLDRAIATGCVHHCRRCHHRVAMPIPQALAAQPQPGTLASRPRPVSGLYGPLEQGLPPRWPIWTQRPQQPSLSRLRAHIRERKRWRPATILWRGCGPYRRPNRDGATSTVRGYSQHQLF